MNNGFFYAEILNTNRTLNPIKIFKKSKILHMPKMAQNGPKYPKLGLNTFYFGILGLKMFWLYVKCDTDYPEKVLKKSKILNMPKKAQNGQNEALILYIFVFKDWKCLNFMCKVKLITQKKFQKISKVVTCPKWPKRAEIRS